MNDKAEEQRRLTLDQFTRQAVPFAEMPAHSNRLLIDLADTVLDVACRLHARRGRPPRDRPRPHAGHD